MLSVVTTGSKPSRGERVWKWAREHPSQAVGLAAGAVAFLRLIAISYGRLGTARALLEHTDLVGLSGGLVVSTALLWIPPIAAVAAFAALKGQQDAEIATKIGVLAFVATMVGLILYWDWQNLDLRDVPRGGPAWLVFVIVLGAGVGSFLHPILRFQSRRGTTATKVSSREPVPADGGKDAGSSVVPPNDEQPDEPADHVSFGKRVRRVVETMAGGLLAFAGFVWSLGVLAILVIVIGWVLSEPSQPPENITVVDGDFVVTETVHVIDDAGEEWLVMRRSDRTVRSIAASAVRGRYVCRNVNVDGRLTDQVRKAGFGSMWGRSTNRAAATPSDIDELASDESANEFQRDSAREWVDAVLHSRPPCEMEWTSDELAEVRADLGHECHELTGCVARDDEESAT